MRSMESYPKTTTDIGRGQQTAHLHTRASQATETAIRSDSFLTAWLSECLWIFPIAGHFPQVCVID